MTLIDLNGWLWAPCSGSHQALVSEAVNSRLLAVVSVSRSCVLGRSFSRRLMGGGGVLVASFQIADFLRITNPSFIWWIEHTLQKQIPKCYLNHHNDCRVSHELNDHTMIFYLFIY